MRFDTEYGYESLALNIVVQAAKDYRKALWCETIISVDPEILMKKLQKEAGFDGMQQM